MPLLDFELSLPPPIYFSRWYFDRCFEFSATLRHYLCYTSQSSPPPYIASRRHQVVPRHLVTRKKADDLAITYTRDTAVLGADRPRRGIESCLAVQERRSHADRPSRDFVPHATC